MTQIPIALQLYTVRDAADADLIGTLSTLSKVGYKNVELAGLYGKTASELSTIFVDNGLKPVSAHTGLDSFGSENVAKTIEDYQALGVETLVVPWLAQELRTGKEGYLKLAERFNTIGELVSKYGFNFGYHNHDFEFTEKIDGTTAFEFLIAHTDPSLVSYELDTGWAVKAGQDPVAFIKKNPTRFSLLHIKDIDKDDNSWAPVGTGLLPLDGLVDVAAAAGVRYLVVEQDDSKGPALDAVTVSINNLKAKGYA